MFHGDVLVAAGVLMVDFLPLDDSMLVDLVTCVRVGVGVVTVAVCKKVDQAANESLGPMVDDAVVPDPKNMTEVPGMI